MSEQQEAQESATESDESAAEASGDGSADGGEDAGAQSREAAKYRKRLRDAESERDNLAATVESMRKAEVERLAAGKLGKPDAIWQTDVHVADMLTEDGQVSAEAVATACDKAVSDFGLAEPTPSVGAYVPEAGIVPDNPLNTEQFSDAFRPR